jgi:hypothetical protein
MGKALEKEGDAWTAGKALFPILSEGPNPKIPLTWEYVTSFWIFKMVGYMCCREGAEDKHK